MLVFVIGAAFWWSVGSGQFDDLDSPAYRVVADEDRIERLDLDQRPAARDGGP